MKCNLLYVSFMKDKIKILGCFKKIVFSLIFMIL